MPDPNPHRQPRRSGTNRNPSGPPALLSRSIGHTRYIVLLAVIAVILVAVSLFLFGTIQAVHGMFQAWNNVIMSSLNATDLAVEFLEIVSTMLKAVVFYIIGVGLYSLFIAPLNLTVSLGVESLNDLESKVISVVIVIMAITFLEHFIHWKEPLIMLQFAGAFALVVVALVLFQFYSHRSKEEQKTHHPDEQARARRDLFEHDDEEHHIDSQEVYPRKRGPVPQPQGQPSGE